MRHLLLSALVAASTVLPLATASAESFVTATGAFVKEGETWKEVPTGATFKEFDRNENGITIWDQSRNMFLFLPLDGGIIYWSDSNNTGGKELATGRYIK